MEFFIFYSIITELDRVDCKFKNTNNDIKNAKELYINKCVENILFDIGLSNPDSGCKVGTNNVIVSPIHNIKNNNLIPIAC